MSKAPDRIYLQWHGDASADEREHSCVGPSDLDVTWCRDLVYDGDLIYLPATPEREAAEEMAQWLRKAAHHKHCYLLDIYEPDASCTCGLDTLLARVRGQDDE